VDDLRDGRFGFGRPQGNVLLDRHRRLRRPGSRSNGASRNNGWYAGGGFDYMVHKGPLVDVILGLEYQHYDVGARQRSAATFCSPLTIADYDLNAKATSLRARLTIKTQGYGFFYR
jgi:hypothetical protein